MAAPRLGKQLVQGVAMLPEYVAQLRDSDAPYDIRALYLINTNPKHTEEILEAVEKAKQTDPGSNWMAQANWSENRVRKYMDTTYELSERRREEASRFGFPWVDMGSGNFSNNVMRNVQYLAGRITLRAA
jgi:hypothetical protein